LKDGTLRSILNRIYWGNRDELHNYSILVIDRLAVNGTKVYGLSNDIKVLSDRIIIEDKVIPLHRVIAVLRNGEVIWRRSASQNV